MTTEIRPGDRVFIDASASYITRWTPGDRNIGVVVDVDRTNLDGMTGMFLVKFDNGDAYLYTRATLTKIVGEFA
jgi:hypothetical protein